MPFTSWQTIWLSLWWSSQNSEPLPRYGAPLCRLKWRAVRKVHLGLKSCSAGNVCGKLINFDDPQSWLFFTWVRWRLNRKLKWALDNFFGLRLAALTAASWYRLTSELSIINSDVTRISKSRNVYDFLLEVCCNYISIVYHFWVERMIFIRATLC